jgi:hypothetical protein
MPASRSASGKPGRGGGSKRACGHSDAADGRSQQQISRSLLVGLGGRIA